VRSPTSYFGDENWFFFKEFNLRANGWRFPSSGNCSRFFLRLIFGRPRFFNSDLTNLCVFLIVICRECDGHDPDANEAETIESRSFARRTGRGWRPGTAASVATQTLRLHGGSVHVVFQIGIVDSPQLQNGL
jgi:hypothetical protein